MRFGISGPDVEKLKHLRQRLALTDPACIQWPIVVAEITSTLQASEMVKTTKVILNLAGPFTNTCMCACRAGFGRRCVLTLVDALAATELVKACVNAGVHYVDTSGETPWMKMLIDRFHAQANSTGSYIVPACGFVSAAADLGTWLSERVIKERAEREVREVHAVVYDTM